VKFDDFMRTMLTAWPDAEISENPYTGEILVHTGYKLDGLTMVKLEHEEAF
jgi:hypothetical protein